LALVGDGGIEFEIIGHGVRDLLAGPERSADWASAKTGLSAKLHPGLRFTQSVDIRVYVVLGDMKISGSTALVTGAKRGLGRAFVQALRDAGGVKIYAAARTIEGLGRDGVVEPVQLDITKPEQVAAAAARCQDVDILINNAGVARFVPALGAPTMDDARLEIETNYLGTLAMGRAFAPVLKRNGGGVLVNMLSVVSFFNAPMQGSYCASKAAEWSLTKAMRFELRAQGTLVIGVYAGYIDTEMTAGLTAPKSSPADIAARVIEGIANGTEDILADKRSRTVFAELRKDDRPFDATMQKLWDSRPR
jgi:NAD(P)-dependent dehydrogenase (short-subunit alcohol dehydrogenase family)